MNPTLFFLKKNKELYFDGQEYEPEPEEPDFNEPDYRAIPDDIVMGFIQQLPAGCRTVLNMYVFEDMSHQEISKQLGINEGASRVRLTRAKSLLAEKLKQHVE